MDDAGGLMYSLSRKAECEGELPLVRVWPCGVHTVNCVEAYVWTFG